MTILGQGIVIQGRELLSILSFDRGNDFARIGWEEGILQMSLSEEATMTVSTFVFCPLVPLSRLLLFQRRTRREGGA